MMLENENKCWYETRLHVAVTNSLVILKKNNKVITTENLHLQIFIHFMYKIKYKLQFSIKQSFKAKTFQLKVSQKLR